MTSQERNKIRARRRKRTQSLKPSFKKVSPVSHAQLAHFSTLAEEKHMLLILNFSTFTYITNARTTMPFARLHSQMVCTQSEPAEMHSRFHTNCKHVHSCPNSCCINQFHTSGFTGLADKAISQNVRLLGCVNKTCVKVSHFNPCPRILNRAMFLMTLLLRAIFKYSGKTNCACASETGLSGKAKQIVISHRLF